MPVPRAQPPAEDSQFPQIGVYTSTGEGEGMLGIGGHLLTARWVLAVGLLAGPWPAHATNGLNLIGFGAESIAMGGADVAVARDSAAMNINPAGMTQIQGGRLDLYGAAAFLFGVRHRDAFGNDAAVENTPQAFGNVSYAARAGESGLSYGFGVFAQGGAGYEYPSRQTAFGTRDELSSLLRIAKLTPSIAYRWSGALSVGVSLGILYGDIEQHIFPDTSFQDPEDPARTFLGSRLKDARGVGLGAKLGVRYRPAKRVAIGAVYTTESSLDLKDGELETDMTALGLGRVRYRDADALGLRLPREAAVGVAVQATDHLLIAADVGWIDWSRAVDTSRLVASGPDHPDAPPVLAFESEHRWRDQWVYALGLLYEPEGGPVLRAGYNYGRNPIPDRYLNPLLASTAEHHLTAGLGYRLGDRWSFDAGIEYLFRNKVVFTNPALPFGERATARGEAAALHMTLSRTW